MDYSLFDNVRVGIMIINQDSCEILYANNWVKEMTGRAMWEQGDMLWQALIGQNPRELTEEADRQMIMKGWFRTECMILIDGKKMWLDVRGNFLQGNGSVMCVILTDITDIKRLETDVTNIAQSIPGGMVILAADDDLTLSYANPGYYKLLGYSEEDFYKDTGNKVISTIPSKDKEHFLKSMYGQIAGKGRFQLEEKLLKMDGTSVWISFNGIYAEEENAIYCVLVDVSEQIDTILSLQMEQKLNQIVFGLSGDILFNLDLKEQKITYSENAADSFSMKSQNEKFPENILWSGVIAPESVSDFLMLADSMYGGRKVAAELQLKDRYGSVRWYRVEYDFLYASDQIPLKAVGKMIDINEQKNMERRIALDPLTRLYNKTETQKAIENCIKAGASNEKHAFLMVDIDDFKRVNDTLGHHFGDMVLIEIAGKIREMFDEHDVIGRIGGDEFAILIRNVKSIDETLEKATALAEVFRHTFSGENHNYKISGSIGISFYPQNGTDYETLYRNADLAMYESKRKGKDRYTIYTDNLDQCTYEGLRTQEEPKRGHLGSYKEKLVFTIFDLLYETKDIYTSVNKVLEIVGREFDVDRCYIFQASQDGTVFNNTFEWCREGIPQEIENLQGISKEALEYGLAQYDDDGIMACSDLRVLGEELFEMLDEQGIKSMLHCGIPATGERKVLIGFDDCKRERIWQEEEIASLAYISKLLGIYLIGSPEKEDSSLHKRQKSC